MIIKILKHVMGGVIYKDYLHFIKDHRWKESNKTFLKLFLIYPEFRSLLDYRFKSCGILGKALRIFTYSSKQKHNCYVSSKGEMIGAGLYLEHAFSTIINVQSMGENCHVYQQVTIGWANGGQPTIGNNVMVCAGSLVLGPITIGDDVIIGAGSVVVKDIPSHSIVVGNPAKIIKTRKSIDDQWSKVE